MTQIIATGRALLKDRKGVTAMEYGLIAMFVAVGLITILGTVGTNLTGVFQRIATALGAPA